MNVYFRWIAAALLCIVQGFSYSAYAQKLLDLPAAGGPLTNITASSGGSNTSVSVAYSVRQLKTTYDHSAITAPSAVSGFTNSSTPILRVRRSSDNGQLDIGYLSSGMLDTVTLKNFAGSGSGYVSVWYDQSGNSRDALQGNTTVQPRIVNSGVLDVNQSGVPGMMTVNGQFISDGSGTGYGITGNRTLNVVCQPKVYTNGGINGCCGTYALDRSPIAGDNPLTSIKISSDKWGLQIRTDAGGGLGSSFEGTTTVNANRTDNLTAMRSGDVYSLEVNGISMGSATVSGVNTMDPVRMGYGSIYTETVYYGEVLLFGSVLSATDRYALYNNQNPFFNVGGGFTWTGATSTDWNTSSNWSNNTVPGEGSSVIVPSGTTNALTVTAAQTTLKIYKLTVNSGATVTINGNLNVTDSVNANGTITGTGTITLSGGIYAQYIKGTFGNLTNSNTAETIYASSNVTVNGTLTNPSGGKIDFIYNNFVGSTATISNSGNIYSRSMSNPPMPTGKTWGGTVTYTGTTGGRYIVDGTYTNLVMNNTSGTNTATGNITINGALTTTAGGAFTMSTYALSGSLTTITNSGTIITANTSAAPLPSGKTWIGTVSYNATTGSQTVAAGTYNNLTMGNTSGTQTAGGALTVNGTLTVPSGATFNLATYQLTAVATISNNGTIKTSNTSTTPLPTGKTWGGTVEYFAVSGGQTIVTGTYNNLTLSNNSGTQTAGGDLVVNGALTFPTYSLLNMGIYVLSGTLSSISISTAGEIQTANTSANPLPSGKSWGSASVITYNAPTGGQTVVAGTYTHLQLSNTSGTQTTNGNISIDQRFIVAAGATLNMGTYVISGNITSPELSGTLQTAVLSGPFPTGKTWGGTVEFNAATAGQTIGNNTFNNLTISSTSGTSTATGQVTVTNNLSVAAGTTFDMGSNLLWGPMSGTITINGTLKTTHNDGIPNNITWGGTGTVNYALTTGGQTIAAGTYYNLTVGNTIGTSAVQAAINVNGTLTTQSGGTFDMSTYALGGTMNGLSHTGTLKTQNTSLTPIPAGKTWGGTVEYNASATQTISNGTYNNLTLTSGTKNAGGDLVVNGILMKDNMTLDMKTYALSGTLAAISNNNAEIRTANTSANPLPSGRYWGTASWMTYNATTGGQTVVSGTYVHLNLQNTSGTQTANGDLSIDQRFIIVTGSTLSMGTYTLSGNITSPEVSGTLQTANTSATPIPVKNWGTGTIVYNATTGGQTIVNGTYYSLTMGNTSGIQTANGNLVVNGILTTTTGGSLALGTNTLTGTLATITNNGTIKTTNTSSTPLASNKTWGGSGTIQYAVTTGAQTVIAGTYNNLLLSNTSGTNTAAGNIGLTGTLTVQSGGIFDLTTFQFTGASGTISNSGTIKTANTSSAPLPSGKTWGGTVTYYATTGGQTVAGGTYNNLLFTNTSGTNTANGAVGADVNFTVPSGTTLDMGTYRLWGPMAGTVSMAGTVKTANTEATAIPTLKTWGGTVEYNNTTGGQYVANGTYNNLTISNTSGSATAWDNLTINGTLTTTSGGTLDMLTYTLGGTLATITNNGTIKTTNTSATPIPSGRTWTGTIEYGAATGGQTIMGGGTATYNNLKLSNTSGTSTVSANLTVNGTLTTTAGGTMDMSTRSLSGTLTTITNNGTIRTASTSGSALPDGRTWGGTVDYYATTGAQTVSDGTYNNLTISNTSGTQTVHDDIVVNGTLTTTAGGTLSLSTKTLGGTLSSIVNNGTISTSNTSAAPVPSGKTWNGSVIYNATTGGQSVAFGSYYNLMLSNTTGTQSLNGSTTVGGVLTMSGGKLALGSNTLNINGTMSGHSATSSFAANGTSNISIGGSGALGTNLFFDQTTPGITNRLNNLTYNRASQTIILGSALQVAGIITPTAGTLATGNILTLISNASNTAMIAAGSGSYITGTVTAERYIPSIARRWRFLASPVIGATFDDWQNEIFITGAGGATNGFDATTSNQAGAYGYDETVPGNYNSYGSIAPSTINDPLVIGKGYRVFIRGDRSDPGVLNGTSGTQAAVTMNVIGAVNTNNIVMPVTYTNTGAPADDGWNMAGNPYPSPIDWNAFHDAGRTGSSPDYSGTDYAHLDAVISTYDVTIANYVSYNAVSNTGTGSLSNGVLPSGSSFWVKATAASPSMIMKEIYKTSATPAAMFKEGPAETFTLKLVKDAITADEMLVKYIPDADRNFDVYDIVKRNGEVNISSITEDGTLLTGNCKPFNGISDTIRLNMTAQASGNYSFETHNAKLLSSDKGIYLVDAFTHKVIDMNAASTYTFAVDKTNASSFGPGRFMIVVGDLKPTTTAIPEFKPETHFTAYPTITSGEITINTSNTMNKSVAIVITDVTGKQIASWNNIEWNNQQIKLDLSAYKAGAYFISITSDSVNETVKCIKKD
jgi:hypothetical protein